MTSILEILNIINGILYVQISTEEIEKVRAELEKSQHASILKKQKGRKSIRASPSQYKIKIEECETKSEESDAKSEESYTKGTDKCEEQEPKSEGSDARSEDDQITKVDEIPTDTKASETNISSEEVISSR